MALTPEDIQRIREEEEARQNIRRELNAPKPKSVALALLWTVLFGCFGLFYVSATAGVVGSIVGLLILFTMPILGPVVWIISVVASVVLVQDMNKTK